MGWTHPSGPTRDEAKPSLSTGQLPDRPSLRRQGERLRNGRRCGRLRENGPDQILDRPELRDDPGGYRGRHAERGVDPGQVVRRD